VTQITHLSVLDATNAITIGRISAADITFSRAEYTTWLAAHPTATVDQVEAGIQSAIATKWPSAPVQVLVHVFDLIAPNIGVCIADLGEPIPAQWWVNPT